MGNSSSRNTTESVNIETEQTQQINDVSVKPVPNHTYEEDTTVYIRKWNQVIYAIGKNIGSECGLTHTKKDNTLTCLHFDFQELITNIYSGAGHAIYSHNLSNFWSAGDNSCGQCFTGDRLPVIMSLEKIKYFETNKIRIHKVCTNVTGKCTFWINEQHKAYGSGPNTLGQLGLGDIDKNSKGIHSIDSLTNAMDIKSSLSYSIALCAIRPRLIIEHWYRSCKDDHTMELGADVVHLIANFYGCGSSVYGTGFSRQGGHGFNSYTKKAAKWTKNESLSGLDIIGIATGMNHSIFLGLDGNVWSCGSNKYRQRGMGVRPVRQALDGYKSLKIPYFSSHCIKIIEIKCGLHHNLALDIDGKLWTWGWNLYGQCGVEPPEGRCTNVNVEEPKVVSRLKNYNIIRFDCGAKHSYGMTDNGLHFLWGRNHYGECLEPNEYKVKSPFLINDVVQKQCEQMEIKSVHLGDENTKMILGHIHPKK
eukprot:197374_1